jgi:E3 SUMO-protein ligase PIAS1
MSPVDDLAARVRTKKIPKASVIKEMTKAAHDPDVVATSQVLSLKCPLTYMRLKNPARSTTCPHIQCFDVTSYLHLQEQGPQWICPICNKPAAFENLAIDEYVKDILDRTRDSTEQVTIEPDGQWRTEAHEEPEPKRPRISGASLGSVRLDDDDVISLEDDFGVVSSRNTQTPSRSMLGTRTPSVSRAGMNGSSTPNGAAGSSRKRTAEVIDLTLSDSEDDAPPPTKRQNTGITPTPGPEWSFPAPFQNS